MIAMCGQWVLEGYFVGGRGLGSETRPDCEVDWLGLGAGELWKAERRAERSLTESLRKGQAYEITAYLRNVLLGKVCVFWEVLQIFHRQLFIFLGYLTLPRTSPFVVWTNCVAQCPLSQYEKVPFLFFSSSSFTFLSKHSMIVCVFFECK